MILLVLHCSMSEACKKTTYSVSRDVIFLGFSHVCHTPSYASSKLVKHLYSHARRRAKFQKCIVSDLSCASVVISNPDPIAVNDTSYISIINMQFKPPLSIALTKNQTYRLVS